MAKSALFSKYATDTSREEDGVPVDFGEGIKVTIRRASSRASQDARRKAEKESTDVIRRGDLPTEKAEEILVRQLAEGVIVTWEGVTNEDGEELPPTLDNKLFILRKLPDFRNEVLAISIERDNFKRRVVQDAEGNS